LLDHSGGDDVEGLEGGGKLLGVLVAGGLDSIVINNQTEEDRTGSMGIEILRGRRRLLDRGQRWRREKTFYRRSEMRGVAIDGSSQLRRWRGLPVWRW
jgi:hypothetical protein